MLVNFCDASLRTEVTCSTISTEGHDVTNLTNNSCKGFLAYSCIKPPVSIDFSFICNVQVTHVIIWPQIGAQKSCGFKLSFKSSDASDECFTDVSTGFIQKEETGLLCYRRDLVNHEEVSVPPVSPICARDVAMNVMALWSNRLPFNNTSNIPTSSNTNVKKKQEEAIVIRDQALEQVDVPEDFLDPLTCEIMTQPIILPSGKIIDQRTLERHAQNEAIWGRPPSDPFTGIRFSNVHKPVTAVPLKVRIDKFLVENSNRDDIVKLPRVLGSVSVHNEQLKLINCEILNERSAEDTLKIGPDHAKIIPPKRCDHSKRSLVRDDDSLSVVVKRSFHGHTLPVAVMKNSTKMKKNSHTPSNLAVIQDKIVNSEEIQRNNFKIQEELNVNVIVDSMPACKCCTNKVFYQLPCQHVICRKALLSLKHSSCTLCKSEFERSDLQRIHLANLNQ
ncbi:hypothetical protein QAD02_023632 [Eretmocerus hayati]|uniref:Uncharacterized protein n=1 Tax=Eretmocerus hayati TaxID=131215 RepID=A0ACC2PY04_9HYME|nr:hypothetical protein QAD02_023632 [Eretmocerus hayati]